MSVSEFAQGEHEMLERFVDYWERQHEIDPDGYPEDFNQADWEEQFIAYAELYE
jgi:hypothetical protein